MAAFMELKGAGLIEKDTSGDVIWVWSYPSITAEQREFLQLKSGLGAENANPVNFLYCQWRQVWYYILHADFSISGGSAGAHLSKVTDVALVLTSRDFNPEKYETLCQIFLRQYKQTGSPTSVLESYLSVVTRGTCANDENGKFSSGDYDKKQAYSKVCLKDIIQTFGVETILLYTAMLLKKRVLIYCPPHSLGQLLEYTRSLPAFVWHRQNWNIVYPYVHLSEPEDLVSVSHFVAGVTEAAAEGRVDLYDLFVNTPNSQISIAPHAKESFAMGKLHKDIALAMVQIAEEEDSTDQDIIKTVASKTKELLNNLKSLATTGEDGQLSLSLETLQARKMPPATENFLFSLAACEGFVQL